MLKRNDFRSKRLRWGNCTDVHHYVERKTQLHHSGPQDRAGPGSSLGWCLKYSVNCKVPSISLWFDNRTVKETEEEEEMEGKYVHVKVCGRGSFAHADTCAEGG